MEEEFRSEISMILSEGRLNTDEIHALFAGCFVAKFCRLFRGEISMIRSEGKLTTDEIHTLFAGCFVAKLV